MNQRGISASGHEMADADPGLRTMGGYSLESYALGLNHYRTGLLARLDKMPKAAGIVWVTIPKVEAGAGFAARVIAGVP